MNNKKGYTQLGYGDNGTFNGLKSSYELDELHEANITRCVECNEEIEKEFDLCEQCATDKWNEQSFDAEKQAIAEEQEKDLQGVKLTWWNKPINQSESDYYKELAISKGYDE